MMYITRIEHFNAAHQLWNEDWSEEKNKEVFGKCANKNFHGHNYELHITVRGTIKEDTGFVMNAKVLGDIIKEKIVEVVDHRNLNLDVAFMHGKKTSAENFAKAIWDELKPEIGKYGAEIFKIKLVETFKIYIEYYGE